MKAVFGVLSVLSIILVQDARPTLPEEAQRLGPKPVYLTRSLDRVLESLDSVIATTDVAFLGRVVQINAHLSADQKSIFTDYSIQPLRVIWPRPKEAPSATRPGIQPQAAAYIVVERWGGTMTLGGVQVTQEDSDLRAFRQGEELILFLKFDKGKNKYSPVSPSSGIFYLERGRIRSFLRDSDNLPVFDSVRGMTLDEFDVEVNRRSR